MRELPPCDTEDPPPRPRSEQWEPEPDDDYADRLADRAHDSDRHVDSADWSWARLGRQR